MLRRTLALAWLAAAACPTRGDRLEDPLVEVRRASQALTLPPTAAALAALQTLQRTEGGAACAAREARLHYLVDLFDFARLSPRRGDRPGHAELWRALELPGAPGRGALATRMVLERIALARRAARVACGGDTPLLAAADLLLALDRRPRRTLPEARLVALAYKRLVAGGGPLAANSELRLLDWCSQALRLAAGGDPGAQHARINQCLIPLWDADPAPYFDASPASRPTDPPWTTIAGQLSTRRRRLESDPAASRLRPLLRALDEEERHFLAHAAPLLPTALDLARVALPRSEAGTPWDRTPVVLLGDRGALVGGRAVLAEADASALETAIASRLHNDRRGRVCLAASPRTPVDRVLEVARAARRAGATVLELGVVREVARRAPPGDVQAEIFGDRPVLRLETLPVSLALYSTPVSGGRGRDQPLGIGFDRDSAPSELALILGRTEVTAVSRDGALAPRPRSELAPLIATLRRAYPDDSSLLLGLEASLDHGALLRALEVARRPGAYATVAIAASGMVPRGEGDLGALLASLSTLRVVLRPAGLPASLAPRLRRCYLDARPRAWPAGDGELVLRVGGKGTRAVAGSLRRDRALRRCVESVLSDADLDEGTRIEVRFSLSP